MPPAIVIESLSKKYLISHQGKRGATDTSVREALSESLSALARSMGKRRPGRDSSAGRKEEFWALRDVSLEIEQGERLGLIGRNGAGKSTLLKILSRITEPTSGRARIVGRVASLLEVGTGFHPELTGRENIFLNGAILGMTRAEIRRRFDEIVAFAEIEKFLDTPVKRYSSGMYVRLAFGVAAHLEPEILLVDEVLAVGDAAFQRKCLGKMGDVSRQGRTVIFVSHNMAAIRSLCERVVLLKDGRPHAIGLPDDIVARYMADGAECEGVSLGDRRDRLGNGKVHLTRLSINGLDSSAFSGVCSGDAVRFDLDYATDGTLARPSFHIAVYDQFGAQVIHLSSRVTGLVIDRLGAAGRATCVIPRLPLPPQRYQVNVAVLQEQEILDKVERVFHLDVTEGDFYRSGDTSSLTWAKFLVEHDWEHSSEKQEADSST